MGIRTLVVDDDTLFRVGVRSFLDEVADVVGVAEAPVSDALAAEALRLDPDVVVFGMPDDTGYGLARMAELRTTVPRAEIVVLTARELDVDTLAALAAGAGACLARDGAVEALVEAVRRPRTRIAEPAPTAWDREVIALIAAGHKHAEIAARLDTSKRVVQECHQRLREELQLRSRVDFVQYAARESLLSVPA